MSPPKIADEDVEVVILTDEEVKTTIVKLRGRTLYPSAMLALLVPVGTPMTSMDLNGPKSN